MPTRPTHPREYAESMGFDVMTFGGLQKRVHKGKKKPLTEKQIRKGSEFLEKKMGAGFFPRHRGKWDRGFIAVPSRFLDEDVTWGEHAVMAHELAHGQMFRAIPDRLLGPAKFVATGNLAAVGGFMSIYSGLEGMTGKVLKGTSIGVTGLGVAGLLASETYANIKAAKELKRAGAPTGAYKMPLGSELSYIGRGTQHISSTAFIIAAMSRKRLMAGISAGAFAVGTGINIFGKKIYNKTVGLTNKVMHEKRTQHQVIDTREKTKHLFK